METQMPSPRYLPLTRHLLATHGDQIEMSFSDVERIIGRRLPNSARGHLARSWWANTKTHSQGQGWLDAGWKIDRVDPPAEQITLRRDERHGLAESARSFSFDSDASGLLPAARRMIEDYVEEKGVDRTEAVIALLNDAALDRRRRTIEWFAARSRPQVTDSVDLIREDRESH
jgi:hypothetical protein